MKLQYLGTAAAEGIPAIFCECETCTKSRELGGRNLRTRSQAIIDDKILIDLPADTYMHSLLYNIDMSKIKTLIITHDHGDHLYPLEIANRRQGFAHFDGEEFPLNIYSTHPAYQKLMEIYIKTKSDEENRIKLNKIKPFESFVAEGYKLTPLKADHAPQCEPVIYAIEKDGKTVLYAHDSGDFPEETWEYLKNSDMRFDLVSLDCTFSVIPGIMGNHMNLDTNKIVREKLFELKLADENTKFVVNHFTHNGCATYDEIKKEADKLGFITSYDGMTVEF